MSRWVGTLTKQRRFQHLMVMLVLLAFLIGYLIVPVEAHAPLANILTPFDGLWWGVTTMTGVGYGDYYPVTTLGRVMGMVLEVSGVLAFGLLVSLVTVALNDSKENFNRQRLIDRLDVIDKKLDRLEKHEEFAIKRKTT